MPVLAKTTGNASTRSDPTSVHARQDSQGLIARQISTSATPYPARTVDSALMKSIPSVCQCTSGFNGSACENYIDECAANLCQNGATCEDRVGSFYCKCQQNDDGPLCGSGNSLIPQVFHSMKTACTALFSGGSRIQDFPNGGRGCQIQRQMRQSNISLAPLS